MITRAQLARMIDHTEVNAFATQIDIEELCDEALDYGFAAVSINPVWTSFCSKRLANTAIVVNPTIGFPLGASTAHIKLEEAREAIRNGAGELDVVLNIGALKSGYPQFVEKEIATLVQAAREIPVRAILETSFLKHDEKVIACELCVRARVACVVTVTGFGMGGATVEDVQLMRNVVGDDVGVKAAGGIRTYAQVCELLQAGADRIGTSVGIDILADARA